MVKALTCPPMASISCAISAAVWVDVLEHHVLNKAGRSVLGGGLMAAPVATQIPPARRNGCPECAPSECGPPLGSVIFSYIKPLIFLVKSPA